MDFFVNASRSWHHKSLFRTPEVILWSCSFLFVSVSSISSSGLDGTGSTPGSATAPVDPVPGRVSFPGDITAGSRSWPHSPPSGGAIHSLLHEPVPIDRVFPCNGYYFCSVFGMPRRQVILTVYIISLGPPKHLLGPYLETDQSSCLPFGTV